MTSINVDGNFELEHMNMRHPEADIALSNGESFMVESSNYQYHLGMGADVTEVNHLKCPVCFILTLYLRSQHAAIIEQ